MASDTHNQIEIMRAIRFLESYGYDVRPKRRNVRIERCVCGKKSTTEWLAADGYVRECNHCGLRGEKSRTKEGAKANFNKAVMEAQCHAR